MRRILASLVAVALTASLATDAASQCSITHTAVSGAYELCAVGGSEWQWTGPAGFTAASSCITVSAPGTYTLRLFDGLSGLWSAPCDFSFVDTPPMLCPITGPDSVCTGATVSWCGPTGNYQYNWMGPNGALGSTACLQLSEPGDYTLDYHDPATGAGDICTRTLFVRECIAPPPPPPTHQEPGCPLTAREWSRSCSRAGLVDATSFAAVAAAVDARSAVWSFSGTSDGLCALLRRDGRRTDRDVACRQYAALLANLSAGTVGVTASDGRKVGLDPQQSLDGVLGVPVGTTLSMWIDRTESTLLAQQGRSLRDRTARDDCRRIARQARAIMRNAPGCGTALSAVLDDDDDAEVFGGRADAPAGTGVISTTHGGDPLTGAHRLRWTLERASDIELAVVDVTGRRVRHLAQGTFLAGTHEFSWDGRDDDGRMLSAGAYFVVGRIGSERTSARLFLLR